MKIRITFRKIFAQTEAYNLPYSANILSYIRVFYFRSLMLTSWPTKYSTSTSPLLRSVLKNILTWRSSTKDSDHWRRSRLTWIRHDASRLELLIDMPSLAMVCKVATLIQIKYENLKDFIWVNWLFLCPH